MNFFAAYDKKYGFKVSIDGLHNAPNSLPYGAVFSLAPPANLYLNDSDEGVQICSSIDWETPFKHPRWQDGFYHFKDIPGQANMSLVVDV